MSHFFPGNRAKQPGSPFLNSEDRNLDIVKNRQVREDVDHLERTAKPQPDPFVDGQLGDVPSFS